MVRRKERIGALGSRNREQIGTREQSEISGSDKVWASSWITEIPIFVEIENSLQTWRVLAPAGPHDCEIRSGLWHASQLQIRRHNMCIPEIHVGARIDSRGQQFRSVVREWRTPSLALIHRR